MSREKRGIYKTCNCGNKFYVKPYLINKKRFCSNKCANIFNGKKLSKDRLGKGNPMFGKKSWNSGLLGVQVGKRSSENHFWKGGKLRLNYRIRRTNEYKKWRKEVFERDNYTCQNCGNIGGELCPHHIISLQNLIRKYNLTNIIDSKKCKELWDINNGQTLCHECHKLTDSYSNNKN